MGESEAGSGRFDLTLIGALFLGAILLAVVAFFFSAKSAILDAKKLEAGGDRSGSIALLMKELEEHPDHHAARRFLAEVLERDGRHDDALAHSTELLFALTESTTAATVSTDFADSTAQPGAHLDTAGIIAAGMHCSRLASMLHRPQEAYLALQRCDSISSGLDQAARADFIRALAEVSESAGEATVAIESWRRLAEIAALSPQEHLSFGKLLTRMQKWEESVDHLKIALDAMHNDPSAARLLAQAYNKTGQHQEAWSIYKTLFAQRPNEDRVALAKEYVTTLEQVGNISGAIEVIEQVIHLPEAGIALRADLICMSGDMLVKSKRPEEARREWLRALSLLPNFAPACARLGLRPKPTSPSELISYVRELSDKNFRKLFERILVDWGYTLQHFNFVDRDSLDFAVKRPEESKMLRKLVRVKRWDSPIGKFPLEDLRIDVAEQKCDGGVYIVVSQFSMEAMIDARRAGNIELFAGAELVDLVARIDLPPNDLNEPIASHESRPANVGRAADASEGSGLS